MTPRALVLLTLLSIATGAACSRPGVPGKCCPSGQIFTGESCGPAAPFASRLHTIDAVVGLPNCSAPEDVTATRLDDFDRDDFDRDDFDRDDFDRDHLPNAPACLEMMHESPSDEGAAVIVHCRSDGNRSTSDETSLRPSLPRVSSIRRCCPASSGYDSRSQLCVPGAADREDTPVSYVLDKLLRKNDTISSLIVTRGPPRCLGKAIFDYEVDADNVSFGKQTTREEVPSLTGDSHTEEISFAEDNACLEATTDRKLVLRTCRDASLCSGDACVRKCCPEDEVYVGRNGCAKPNSSLVPIEFHDAVRSKVKQSGPFTGFGVLIGVPCENGKYATGPDEEWYITQEGSVYVHGYKFYRQHEYCLDILQNHNIHGDGFYLFICFGKNNPESQSPIRVQITTTLLVISCVFLFLTFLVYAYLPVLHNLHGKTLMCHVASLFLAYVSLMASNWVTPSHESTGLDQATLKILYKILGYVMLFSFLSAFSWLNVMCFDIWWSFRGFRGVMTRNRAHMKRFLIYCCYAWGLALGITVFGIVADVTNILPYYVTPNIGLSNSWFTQNEEHYGVVVFFIGPITIQLTANVVFFILTAVHCTKVKAEIRRVSMDPLDPRNKRFHADRTKLAMNVRLFVVMGMSWTMEVISFFLNNYARDLKWRHEFFYVSDVFNCLQGLIMFVLFVVKHRVYVALRRRLGLDVKQKGAGNATNALQDPFQMKKSVSNSTLTSTFAISQTPSS